MAKALAEIAANLGDPATLRVGFLEGATAPNGDSIPLRAALNEFGHGNVPPRPFFRTIVKNKSGEWADGIAHQLKITKYNTALTMARTGNAIAGQLQESILDLWSPGLSPKTIAKKGFDKPLIEAGDMINAVAWELNGANGVTSQKQNNAAKFAQKAAKAAKP